MSVPMKDSGVAWLGKTPAHWGVIQSRRLFGERNEKATQNHQQLTVSQKYGLLLQTQFMQLEGRRVVVVQKGHDILKRTMPGDFVISMRSFQGGLELSEHEGSVSSAYVPITPIKCVVPRYFRWAFKSVTYIQALQATSDLVRDGQALRFENFTKVPLPIVPEDEQAAIGDFLDRATSRIDTLVAKKTRFIKLLREKRQALITHAVTKGVDADVPMKDSGVEWVGLMPAHWQAKRAKFVFSLVQRAPGDDDGIVTAFRDGQVTLRSNRRTDGFTNAIKEAGYQGVRKGDLVIHAMDAFAGAIGMSDSDGKCTPVYSCCTPSNDASTEFYARCVRTMATTGYIESLAKGIRERSTDFRWATFAEQLLPVPPRPEQDAIVSYLDRATSRINTLIAKTERSIELLREHRIAIITVAVTGKIDLRNAV